jgi:nucleoside-diphosphate kinase
MEQLFVMIKPDGVKRGLVGEIISRFEKKGFQIAYMRKIIPGTETVISHYEEHKDKPFYNGLVGYISGSPVVAIIMYGNVKVARKITGATLPWEAEVGSIRGDYACITGQNLVHCSDSVESAEREVKLWKPLLL